MSGHADIIGNRTLAARARQLADAAPPGSLQRRVRLVVMVALHETRSITAARHVLSDYFAPGDDVHAAALELLGELATGTRP